MATAKRLIPAWLGRAVLGVALSSLRRLGSVFCTCNDISTLKSFAEKRKGLHLNRRMWHTPLDPEFETLPWRPVIDRPGQMVKQVRRELTSIREDCRK
jgi:hypothetical protein